MPAHTTTALCPTRVLSRRGELEQSAGPPMVDFRLTGGQTILRHTCCGNAAQDWMRRGVDGNGREAKP